MKNTLMHKGSSESQFELRALIDFCVDQDIISRQRINNIFKRLPEDHAQEMLVLLSSEELSLDLCDKKGGVYYQDIVVLAENTGKSPRVVCDEINDIYNRQGSYDDDDYTPILSISQREEMAKDPDEPITSTIYLSPAEIAVGLVITNGNPTMFAEEVIESKIRATMETRMHYKEVAEYKAEKELEEIEKIEAEIRLAEVMSIVKPSRIIKGRRPIILKTRDEIKKTVERKDDDVQTTANINLDDDYDDEK
jgi:hypothetical protein